MNLHNRLKAVKNMQQQRPSRTIGNMNVSSCTKLSLSEPEVDELLALYAQAGVAAPDSIPLNLEIKTIDDLVMLLCTAQSFSAPTRTAVAVVLDACRAAVRERKKLQRQVRRLRAAAGRASSGTTGGA